MDPIPVFDGHNDTLTRLFDLHGADPSPFLSGTDGGHIDRPRARSGGLVGGFFAVFAPSRDWNRVVEEVLDAAGRPVPGAFTVPLAPPVPRAEALAYTLDVIALLDRIVAESDGTVAVVRDAIALRRCLADGTLAVVLHVEGAEAIAPDLGNLDALYDAGVRSLGPVWSRPNDFGHGVPFDFPRSPDTGPGLTDAGRALVARCNELGILLDLSHLNERGFWDVAKASDAPLVATHSNAWTLCASARNLTDEQLDAVAASGGVVGVNFAKHFLRADGNRDAVTGIDEIVRHVRYLAGRMGVAHVALGSDFDGAVVPDDMTDTSDLPTLVAALEADGFDAAEVRSITLDNWVRVLGDTWRGES